MRIFFILLLALGTVQSGRAQSRDIHKSSQAGQVSLGIGLGLPYGAIGGRLGVNLFDHTNIFAGMGYQVSGMGYNFGLRQEFNSALATQFYLMGMYGTNAAIKVEGLSNYDRVYEGVSAGFGVKLNSRRTEGNYWDLGLIIPFRDSTFDDDYNTIKDDPRVEEFIKPLPVLICVGFNFTL